MHEFDFNFALSTTLALVVELVDTQDLKSCDPQRSYRFKSDPGHLVKKRSQFCGLFLGLITNFRTKQKTVTNLTVADFNNQPLKNTPPTSIFYSLHGA